MAEEPLSGLGERAADVVRRSRGARVPWDAIRDGLLDADLSLVGAPDARMRFAAVVRELDAADVARPPKGSAGWDRSAVPALPRYVVRVAAPREAPAPVAGERTWHAALGWAAGTALGREERRVLEAVNTWLANGGSDTAVPLPERSLQLLGDEKALGRMLRGPLFGPGRLTLDLLCAFRASPPFVYTVTGSGPVALVLENAATYRSVIESLPSSSAIGLAVFGSGFGFVRSVEYLADLIETGTAGHIRHIRYFGDLDAEGLRVPAAASETAREAGLPVVAPAPALYRALLGRGVPSGDGPVDDAAAEVLVGWLPEDCQEPALELLTTGLRLAQEAVGREALGGFDDWRTLEGLGIELPRPMIARPSAAPSGPAALVRTDAGAERSPASDAEWDEWVSAGRTRNFALGDPLLDWLGRYGAERGFVPDHERPGYDPRTDFARFVLGKGIAFEAGVMRLLAEREPIVQIGSGWQDARSVERAEATAAAMRDRAPIIAQAVLRNPDTMTYGMVDLLVRSDVLMWLFPDSIGYEEAHQGAPALGLRDVHYRAVDIKFHTFELTADGEASGDAGSLPYLVQAWIYNEALGRISGAVPPASYLLGRSWTSGDVRGDGCLERLARVDHDRAFPRRGTTLAEVARDAVTWVRRVRREGSSWDVLPTPTIEELYPHARNTEDAPWHGAKGEIAGAIAELTLLPRMNPARRRGAHAAGIWRWDDPAASAAALGVTEASGATQCDAVLEANRAPTPTVLPARISGADPGWRSAADVEFFVDFETTSSLDDDFTALPRPGGQPLIFQIGCGRLLDGEWQFRQWTADRIQPDAEAAIIDSWIAHMDLLAGGRWAGARIIHWSAAEPANLETAYNSARARHPMAAWPTTLPWFDFLTEVVRAEPVTVTGAFNFGLKSIARAMHALGLIGSSWVDGPGDGLGAMVGAWWCDAEARRLGVKLHQVDLMQEVARYNEVDCRVMAEIVTWLRRNR